jgi:hypothetical protein
MEKGEITFRQKHPNHHLTNTQYIHFTKQGRPDYQNISTSQLKYKILSSTNTSERPIPAQTTIQRHRSQHRHTKYLPFTLHQLKRSLMDTDNTAPGGENITYRYTIIKHLLLIPLSLYFTSTTNLYRNQ